ncbi:hypothetical protein [Chelativorans sp. AA-79]|uniref:hypothetical protein n=1 Tax=Chelativorans sp. AA-79 TaxID=3028735 RepID=UPI0023F89723|nr:hypothetical protein [Chelativorans sp. AA-79]WEX12341.1 hypothetical protein PVE73_28105 [Chelativorans sp. AA-79]
MSPPRCIATVLAFAVAILASGCGTPKEKTAPCKRPANLSSYADMGHDCGPMRSINGDRTAAWAAIEQLSPKDDK